jgi:signal peptidase I
MAEVRKRESHRKSYTSLGIIIAIVVMIVVPPLYLRTSTYPIAIVDGNSMYPILQNGDLVLYKAVSTKAALPDGTIIIFVQSATGFPQLDALTRPIVIHRIVGSVITPSGSIYYQTKGDNNAENDSQLVESSHVLGTPVKVIPKVGLILMFFESPQGFVTAIAIVVALYFTKSESISSQERLKKTFLGALAQMVLDHQLPESAFRRIELATEYKDDMKSASLTDPLSVALFEWLRKGGLEGGWLLKKITCPTCSGEASSFIASKKNKLVICPECVTNQK